MNEILVVKIPVKKKGESVHMKKVVAMYEQEEAYGKNLAEYVNRKENMPFESYYNQEIYGTELTTIINKAIDNNNNNGVLKDKKGKYIDNKSNSINIDVKIIDNDKIYTMETLYNGGMENFIQYYNQIKFKCTIIEYHKDTHKVKYMLFEQITQ